MVSALDLISSDDSLQEHWIKRIAAFIIDSIIFWIASWFIFWFWISGLEWYYWYGGWSFLYGGLFFLYAAVMEASSMGATLGKHVLKLRVIPITGQMDAGKAVVRNVSKIHPLFLLLDWLVGFVTDGDPKQKFLDRSAGTTVITTDRLTHDQQHIYQSQQSAYTPPPQKTYETQEKPVYEYPAQQQPTSQTPAAKPAEEPCKACGGRLILTGNNRQQCIRCGKIY
jgi:uncharacterized RDD family membrane protein YckC